MNAHSNFNMHSILADFGDDHAELAAIARRMTIENRMRDKAFGKLAPKGGAWEMLLDLFISHGIQRVSVTSLGLASRVPATTALRWMAALEAEELVVREADERDARRIFVVLTEAGLTQMTAHLRDVRTKLDVAGVDIGVARPTVHFMCPFAKAA